MSRNKKHAILLGYIGTRFHGCQYNKETITVEKLILDSLIANDQIKSDDPAKVGLQRCSRTDKGVHAALNLFVVKSKNDKLEFKTSQNVDISFQNVKENINVYDQSNNVNLSNKDNINLSDNTNDDLFFYKTIRVTQGFCAMKVADAREYEYLVPSFLFEESKYDIDLVNDTCNENNVEVVNKTEINSMDMNNITSNNSTYINNMDMNKITINNSTDIKNKSIPDFIKSFRLSDERSKEIIKLFKRYEGTKYYHNYTNTKNEKGTQRHIKSVEIDLINDKNIDVEFVRIKLVGQSFLYNQIRKMVANVIVLLRYGNKNEIDKKFEESFDTNVKLNIYKAPSQFLMLVRPIFDFYNKKDDKEKLEIDEQELNKVKERIYEEMFRNENILGAWEWIKTVATREKLNNAEK